MILNAWTLTSLFLSGVSVLLALIGLAVAARSLPALRRRAETDVLEGLEQRLHLLSLVLGVLALVRLLDWALFYRLLGSYVPDLAVYGVMCAFGVTRIRPELVASIEIMSPLVLLALGFWWVMARVDRRTETAPLLGARFTLAVPIAALALAECTVRIVYLLVEKASRPVTCCTQFLETRGSELANTLTSAKLAIDAPAIALASYYGLHAAVILFALRARHESRRALVFLVVALALANVLLTYRVWFGVVAPRVLELPYHHCIYELLTDTLALGPAALLAVCGTGAVLVPALLEPFRARAPEAVVAQQRKLWALGAVALASEALMVGVHLL